MFKIFNRRKPTFEVNYKCEFQWFGNKYGGFYVAPSCLNQDSIVYSFGIGEDASFDVEMINHFKCKVFAFDPTPKSISWVEKQEISSKFEFFDFGISAETGQEAFYLPNNKNHVSGSSHLQTNVSKKDVILVEMKCLSDIMKLNGHLRIDVLKMDIEGSEYDVIKSILSLNFKISQILVEVHSRFFKNGEEKDNELLELLTEKGYFLFAKSKRGEELSFINPKMLLNN